MPSANVVVLGAGVVGLSCAVRLLEAGHRVAVWSRDPPADTTSRLAAALWYPYLTHADDRCDRWGRVAFEVFAELADDPATGVLWRTTHVVFRAPVEEPSWTAFIPGFRFARADELPHGYVAGYVVPLPVIEMPVYLGYLVEQVRALGGEFVSRTVHDPAEPFDAGADRVVNCTGLGSRELFADRLLYPVRGQILRGCGLAETRAVVDIDGCTYHVPRAADCILGGTADADNLDDEPDEGIRADILRRCAVVGVDLTGLVRIEDAVGFRPCRATVRCEVEEIAPGRRVVHCYGHGGSGVTLSWGCAESVVEFI